MLLGVSFVHDGISLKLARAASAVCCRASAKTCFAMEGLRPGSACDLRTRRPLKIVRESPGASSGERCDCRSHGFRHGPWACSVTGKSQNCEDLRALRAIRTTSQHGGSCLLVPKPEKEVPFTNRGLQSDIIAISAPIDPSAALACARKQITSNSFPLFAGTAASPGAFSSGRGDRALPRDRIFWLWPPPAWPINTMRFGFVRPAQAGGHASFGGDPGRCHGGFQMFRGIGFSLAEQ